MSSPYTLEALRMMMFHLRVLY